MEVKRGEVWWVSLDDSVGSEVKTGRPALILSSDGMNKQFETVIVAFMTTASYAAPAHPQLIDPTGTKRRVLCEQLRTVDKSRLTRCEYTVSDDDLSRVSGSLCGVLGFKPVVNTVKSASDGESLKLKAELDLYRQLYEKTMNQLVELKFEADLMKARESIAAVEEVDEPAPVEEVPPEVELPAEIEPPAEGELAEINTCSWEDLKRGGCNPTLIENIVKNRPYRVMDDLRRVPGVTQIAYGLLKTKFCCVPPVEEVPEVVAEEAAAEVQEEVKLEVQEETTFVPPAEKVNINTATSKEMSEKLGIKIVTAYYISGHRNKIGGFTSLEELLEVSHLSKRQFERIKDWITIDDPVVVEEVKPKQKSEVKAETAKVNVNTANTRELMAVGFGKSEAARIMNFRKKYSPFMVLDDLLKVDGVTARDIRKLRDKLTV